MVEGWERLEGRMVEGLERVEGRIVEGWEIEDGRVVKGCEGGKRDCGGLRRFAGSVAEDWGELMSMEGWRGLRRK